MHRHATIWRERTTAFKVSTDAAGRYGRTIVPLESTVSTSCANQGLRGLRRASSPGFHLRGFTIISVNIDVQFPSVLFYGMD